MKRRLLAALAALVLATVGAAVLLAYARGADSRALAGIRTVPVLVVTRPVPAGTAGDRLAGSVRTELLPEKAAAQGRVRSLTALSGKVATVDLEPGEQLLATRFSAPDQLRAPGTVAVPAGKQEVTVSLDPERALGGRLAAGDTIGVLLSQQLPDNTVQTHAVLHKVLVTQVVGGTAPASGGTSGTQSATSSGAASGDAQKVLVTLAVAAPDAETVVFGAEHGSLWLTLEPAAATTDGTKVLTRGTVYGEAR
jgi:pilus assembly protein CpaB